MSKEFKISDIKVIDKEKVSTEELLTGDVIKGLSSKSTIQPNTEVEEDEYIKFPDGTTQKVVGETHENGGVKVNIPGETKILSDNLTLTSKQAKMLEKSFDIKVSPKDTYATALDKYVRKIGLHKISSEQQEVFKSLKEELGKKDIDKATGNINLTYLSEKVNNLERDKKPLEEKKQNFFDTLFDMQENEKTPSEKEDSDIFENGGLSKESFEQLCKTYGLNPDQARKMLQGEGNSVGDDNMFPDGGIFVDKSNMLPTGDSLTDTQKQQLLAYYRRHNPQVANAIDQGDIKWNEVALNSGLVSEATKEGFLEGVPVYEQARDKGSNYLPNAKTYGNLSQERVSGFVLKDYYEAKNPGKKFENITAKEVGDLQREYNDALKASNSLEYFSGVDTEKTVADNAFGNRTSSYLRSVKDITGKKEGTIDVDKLFTKTPDEINAELKDYGLTYDQIAPFKSAAYKYIRIGSEDKAQETPEEAKSVARGDVAEGTKIEDKVAPPVPGKDLPRLYFQPDQSVLAPTPMEAHLKGNIRLDRMDPLRVGVESNLAEIADQRNFITNQVDNLPENQRAAVLANIFASSNKAANEAITSANVTNANNISQTNLFNIGQGEKEATYAVNNALSFEERQLKAKSNTEEALRDYYDYNRKVNLTNFQNQQKLNLMGSLFPDYKLDFMGATVNYEPKNPFQLQDRNNLIELQQFLGGTAQPETKE